MINIIDNIRAGKYRSKLPYGLSEDFRKEYREAIRSLQEKFKKEESEAKTLYRKDSSKLEDQFKIDALEAVGLTGHPKADSVYSKAYADGHSSGFEEVYWNLVELAELVK